MSQTRSPRPSGRSSFAAAFLSAIFPGLGHAYAGRPRRAAQFAALPLLLLVLAGLVAWRMRLAVLGIVLQPAVLIALLVVDAALLAYRALVAADAWRSTRRGNAAARGLASPRPAHPLSVAGLLAVVLVMAGVHVAFAWYDLQAYDLMSSVFGPAAPHAAAGSLAIPTAPSTPGVSPSATPGSVSPLPSASAPGASGGPTGAAASPGATAAATAGSGSPAASGSAAAGTAPWNGTGRLNILVVGVNQRPAQATFNTDTMIVVSEDPQAHTATMFSVPRDTVDVPLPPGPAQAALGATFYPKITSLCTYADSRPDLFPGGCWPALKRTLGYFLGLNISYYVEVNFQGFEQVVNTLGGVTIDVQAPVIDNLYPTASGTHIRLYIPTGVQHMNGSQALAYARSRHGSNDFDRSARQQRVLLSLRQQADFGTIIGNLPGLVSALKSAVHTDIPIGLLPQLIDLAQGVHSRSVNSVVFAPPTFEQQVLNGDPRGYITIPYVDRIRAEVKSQTQ